MTVKLYKVGGCVRDELIGRKCKDIDFAVEAPSYRDMVEYILQRRGVVFLESPQFLTVRAKFGGEVADFVLCRKDGAYSDGRRPDEVIPGTIYDDLARRDFTMNAIAKQQPHMSLQYLDPHGGIDDINNKTIRCVGDAEQRFSEDSLRMLRAIRFSIVLDFILTDTIVQLLKHPAMLDKLDNVSEERIREELHKCFAYDTQKTLNVLDRFKLLRNRIFHKDTNLWLMPTSRQ